MRTITKKWQIVGAISFASGSLIACAFSGNWEWTLGCCFGSSCGYDLSYLAGGKMDEKIETGETNETVA